jgi:N utilization substance protein A
VRRLFELEIPEVAEHVIEVRSLAREAGYRSKVAVSCYDSKVDAVGACVGVRGSRIKSIVDELAGERIDIVRWNDSLQVLVPNALQPAEVEDVILCPMLGKVIVLVREDQLSLAIGKKGQNVRLASKLVGWDINVMTQERLDVQLDKAIGAFSQVPGISEELAENLVAQGFFTFDDLSVIEPDQLAELGGLTEEQCDEIIAYADEKAQQIEREEQLAALHAAQAAREGAALAQAGAAAASSGAAPASATEAAEGESAGPAAESLEDTDGQPEAAAVELIRTAEDEPEPASTSAEPSESEDSEEQPVVRAALAETGVGNNAERKPGAPSGNGHGSADEEPAGHAGEDGVEEDAVASGVSTGSDTAENVDAEVSREP